MLEVNEKVYQSIYKQLQATLDRWYKGDPFGWLDLIAEEMTYFSPFFNERLDGKEAVYENVAPAEGQIFSPGYEVVNPLLHQGEDMTVFTYHLKECGEDGSLTAGWKVTEVYRHVGEDWRLIHSHFTPFSEI